MIQDILVAIVVAVAVIVSAWKLMPARGRLRSLRALDAWLASRNSMPRWRARVLEPRIRAAAGPGCDGCAAQGGSHPGPRPPGR